MVTLNVYWLPEGEVTLRKDNADVSFLLVIHTELSFKDLLPGKNNRTFSITHISLEIITKHTELNYLKSTWYYRHG